MPPRTLPTLRSVIRYSEKKNRLSVAQEASQNSVSAALKINAPRKTRRAVTTRGSSVEGRAVGTAVPARSAVMVCSMANQAKAKHIGVTTLSQTHDAAATFRRQINGRDRSIRQIGPRPPFSGLLPGTGRLGLP